MKYGVVKSHCLDLSGLAVSSIVYSVSTDWGCANHKKCATPGVRAETCYGQQLVSDWSVCELDQSFKKEAVSFLVTIRSIHMSWLAVRERSHLQRLSHLIAVPRNRINLG